MLILQEFAVIGPNPIHPFTMNFFKKLGAFFSPGQITAPPSETKRFLDVLEEYIAIYVKENQLNERTATHYSQRYQNIHRFLIAYNYTRLTLDEVKPRIMEELRAWLLTKGLKTCGRRHASLHIDLCKRTIKHAITMEYTGVDWISPIKGQRDKPKPVIYLTMAEVRKLMTYKFRNEMYDIVAKMFAFQCFTGLSYCELFTFKLTDINGRLWIDGSIGRDKTGKTEYVYIFDEGMEILQHFGGKIPMVPNQTCNRILKEIAGVLDIDKHLTTHIGRKTHATLLDELGVTGKTIARQLRNTERITEEYYISKSHKRTENEFEKLGIGGKLLSEIERIGEAPLFAALKASRTRVITETVAFSILFELF